MRKVYPSTSICILLSAFLLPILMNISHAGVEEDDETNNMCVSYSAKLQSMPDLVHMVVYSPKRYDAFEITEVKTTNFQRSFYWCELEIPDSEDVVKRYRHFGYNSSHWWVEKGCGGWFWVTECKTVPSSDTTEDEWTDLESSREDAVIDSQNHPSWRHSRPDVETTHQPSGAVAANDKTLPDTTSFNGASGATLTGHLADENVSSEVNRPDGHHLPGERTGNSLIDDLYKSWPKAGFRFPTSPAMWDWLDNLTWVDVAAQMGFYNSHFESPLF